MSLSKTYEYSVLDKFKMLYEKYPQMLKRGDRCVHWSLTE